jgi:hypothetical protein
MFREFKILMASARNENTGLKRNRQHIAWITWGLRTGKARGKSNPFPDC